MPTTVNREDNNENEIEGNEEIHGIVILCQMDAIVHKCLVPILQLGLACSMQSPKERMNMEEVTKKLHLIKNAYLSSRICKDAPLTRGIQVEVLLYFTFEFA